jgi:hypothetical protein
MLGGPSDDLWFDKVTSTQVQIVVGVNSKLFLDTDDASRGTTDYGAVVYEQERTNTRELTFSARMDKMTEMWPGWLVGAWS